ncbi:Sec-independent protein translocase protein TatB [Mesorhizobium sp. KR1-2]|uniref:Sec-independent protein translocase protein TatB n=1 Tax=Mesorhizobium sp. KR1-2 TaxID=3156609 RepID=UPI0032B41735
MFDIGWSELLVIAIVMIVVVGPKDLPRMLRTFGKTTAKLRAMAGDFQRQFNEALKEAELDDVKRSIDDLRSLNPTEQIKKQLNPFEQAAADVRAGIDAIKPAPSPAPAPASDAAQPAEPLKGGATAMPGASGGEAVAASPANPEPVQVAAATAQPEPAPAKPAKSKAAAAKASASKAAPKVAAAKSGAKVPAAKPAAKAAAKPAAKAAAPKSTKTAAAAEKAKPAAKKTSAGSAK